MVKFSEVVCQNFTSKNFSNVTKAIKMKMLVWTNYRNSNTTSLSYNEYRSKRERTVRENRIKRQQKQIGPKKELLWESHKEGCNYTMKDFWIVLLNACTWWPTCSINLQSLEARNKKKKSAKNQKLFFFSLIRKHSKNQIA